MTKPPADVVETLEDILLPAANGLLLKAAGYSAEAGLLQRSTPKQGPLINEEHLSAIRNMLLGWLDELRHPNLDAPGLARFSYSVEREKLFPHMLQHCPSVDEVYQTFKWLRDVEYEHRKAKLEKERAELSLEKPQTEWIEEMRVYWDILCTGFEKKLLDSLDSALQSHEYLRHKCDWCPPLP